MPGKRERCADGAHHAHQNDDVRDQRDIRHDARQQIITKHERGNQNHAGDGRANAAANRVPAQRRVNIIGRINLERRAQRVLQHIGQFLGLFHHEMTGNLSVARFNRTLDRGRGIQLAVQNDGQPLADIVSGHLAESFRAIVIQPEINLRFAQVAAHRHGVFDDVAGQAIFRLFLHDNLLNDRRAIGLLLNALEQYIAGRNRLVVFDDLLAVFLHHPEFQIRGLLNLRLGAFLVVFGQAWQLNQNAVAARRLNDGLGHAKSIHALAQHLDRLRQRAFRPGHVRNHLDGARTIGDRFNVNQLVGVHFHEERRAALQIQSEFDFARRLALKLVQNECVRIHLILRIEKGEISLRFRSCRWPPANWRTRVRAAPVATAGAAPKCS